MTVGDGYMTILVYSTNGQNYSGIVTERPRFPASVRLFGSERGVQWLARNVLGFLDKFSRQRLRYWKSRRPPGWKLDICEHRVTDANDEDNISGQCDR